MRALVLKEFGRLAVEELPDPVAGLGEVLIRMAATGICGSDIHGYTGENGRRVIGQVMGHESSGRVAAVGADVSAFTVGQAVTFNPVVIPVNMMDRYAGREQHCPDKFVIGVRPDFVSSFAELIAVPERNVVVLPDGMSIEHGALIEPLAVAVHAVRRAGVTADESVLVLGGGPIGQSVVLALLMAGVRRILVSEVAGSRRALIETLGGTAIDPTSTPLLDAVQEHFGELAGTTIDAVGITRTLADALSATKQGGTVCLVGMGSPTLELDAFAVSTQERTIVGSFTYSAVDFSDAAQWIATAPDIAGQLISRQVALPDADAAFTALAAGDGTPGKVLVRFD